MNLLQHSSRWCTVSVGEINECLSSLGTEYTTYSFRRLFVHTHIEDITDSEED